MNWTPWRAPAGMTRAPCPGLVHQATSSCSVSPIVVGPVGGAHRQKSVVAVSRRLARSRAAAHRRWSSRRWFGRGRMGLPWSSCTDCTHSGYHGRHCQDRLGKAIIRQRRGRVDKSAARTRLGQVKCLEASGTRLVDVESWARTERAAAMATSAVERV